MTDGGAIMLESGFPEGLARLLMQMGHRVRLALDGEFGGYQGIIRNAAGVYFGASESRKDGQAAGY